MYYLHRETLIRWGWFIAAGGWRTWSKIHPPAIHWGNRRRRLAHPNLPLHSKPQSRGAFLSKNTILIAKNGSTPSALGNPRLRADLLQLSLGGWTNWSKTHPPDTGVIDDWIRSTWIRPLPSTAIRTEHSLQKQMDWTSGSPKSQLIRMIPYSISTHGRLVPWKAPASRFGSKVREGFRVCEHYTDNRCSDPCWSLQAAPTSNPHLHNQNQSVQSIPCKGSALNGSWKGASSLSGMHWDLGRNETGFWHQLAVQ